MRTTRTNGTDWTRCPTALTAALERAVATGDRLLERQVLAHLAAAGIVVVDRHALVGAIGGEPIHGRAVEPSVCAVDEADGRRNRARRAGGDL